MSVYTVRSHNARLATVTGGAVDTLFINERFEDLELPPGTYEQCTFANVSFKGSTLREATFAGCVFEACYFRKTTFAQCRFPASRFVDCEFIRPRISLTDFSYCRFSRCAPPYRELNASMPGEANLRADLASNLATESEVIGNSAEARQFRIAARKAREKHLLAAVAHENQYYKDHYDAIGRLGAAWQLAFSRLNRWLWGYGEQAGVLVRNLLLLTAGLFPVLFLLAGSAVERSGRSVGYWDCLLLSAASLVNSTGTSGISVAGVARVWVILETATGFIALGLYLSYLLRWITRR